MTMTTSFDEGRDAGRSGAPHEFNPYPWNTCDSCLWEAGWCVGRFDNTMDHARGKVATDFDQGRVAGRLGVSLDANPHAVGADAHAIWAKGREYGEFDKTLTDGRRIDVVTCPDCDEKVVRAFLPKSGFLLDPDGRITRSEPQNPEADEQEDDLWSKSSRNHFFCESCSASFDDNPEDGGLGFGNSTSQPPDGYPGKPFSGSSQKEEKIGSVYFVSSSGLFKFGKASSERRYEDYKQALPGGCEILKVWQMVSPLNGEGWLHKKYADRKVHGSWYHLSPADVREILGFTTLPPSIQQS